MIASEIAKRMVTQERLIAAGFDGFRLACIPSEATPEQIDELRTAFFLGAQHLFACLFRVLQLDENEATPADERTMHAIANELNRFVAAFTLKNATPKGTG